MSDAISDAVMTRPLGVRLAEHIEVPLAPDGMASAVPVFIGWPGQVRGGDAGAQLVVGMPDELVVVGMPDEWPWRWDKTGVLYRTVQHYFDNGGGPCHVLVPGVPAVPEPELAQGLTPELAITPELALTRLARLNEAHTYEALLSEPAITLVAVPQLGELVEAAYRVPGGSGVSGAPGANLSRERQGPDQDRALAHHYIDAWRAMLTHCQARTELFFVLDAPREMTQASACLAVLNEKNNPLGERGQCAALYGPYLVTSEVITDDAGSPRAPVIVPPSGAVLALIGRTDQTQGIWSAPANAALLDVRYPEYRETAAQDWFRPNGVSINLIRHFAGRGTRVWGCRTLAGAGARAMRHVQMRRLLSYIEANLKAMCHFAVFEPNNAITWFTLQGVMKTWLHRLWEEGGLAGARVEQAYQVRVGLGQSMSAKDVQQGRLVARVRVAILQAAEFIDLDLVLNLGESQWMASSLRESGAL